MLFLQKNDDREEFKRMIEDSSKDKFNAIIVHKLDRFARSRYDSAHYKYILKSNGVTLHSVAEKLDGSPESVIIATIGFSQALSESLSELEKEKVNLKLQLNQSKEQMEQSVLSSEKIEKAFNKVRKLFKSGTLKGLKEIIDAFVEKVIVYQDRIEILLNYDNELLKLVAQNKIVSPALARKKIPHDKIINRFNHVVLPLTQQSQSCVYYGGEGEI